MGKLDITANALVSLTIEFAKMSMSFSVESTLAQWKWIRLAAKPRPLYDLREFDEALHGLWGSFILFFGRNSG